MDLHGQLQSDVVVEVDPLPPRAGELQGAICVVIDVLRATSTIVTLFDRGARRVMPVATLAAARKLARETGFRSVGEKNACPAPGFNLYNSPAELAQARYDGEGFVIASTNGSGALVRAANNPLVICGSLLNASACCALAFEHSLDTGLPIHLVCSGNSNKFALDDFVCAGHMVEVLLQAAARAGKSLHLTETARAAHKTAAGYPDRSEAFRHSSGQILLKIGRAADIAFCAQIDQTDVAPLITQRDPLIIECCPAGPGSIPETGLTPIPLEDQQ